MTSQRPSAVVDLEISNPVPPQVEPGRHSSAEVLLRLHGRPLGFVTAPVQQGRVDVEAVVRDLLEHHAESLAVPLVDRALAIGVAPMWPEVRPLLECHPSTLSCMPAVTIAVKPSGDPRTLEQCLASLDAMDYRALDVVVIDDADERALRECRGEVLIVMDDTVTLDRGWVGAAVRVFIADPDAMAVIGLVLPRRLSGRTLSSSILQRHWHRQATTAGTWSGPFVGAFWRAALEAAPAADSLSEKIEGLLQAGHTVVYEPAALAWHASQLVADPFSDDQLPAGAPAVRRIDLADTPRSITDATAEQMLIVEVAWEGQAIGSIEVEHRGTVVSPFRIQDAIARELSWQVLDTRMRIGRAGVLGIITAELARHFLAHRAAATPAAECPLFVAPRPAAA